MPIPLALIGIQLYYAAINAVCQTLPSQHPQFAAEQVLFHTVAAVDNQLPNPSSCAQLAEAVSTSTVVGISGSGSSFALS